MNSIADRARHGYFNFMTLKMTAQVYREGKWYISFCPEFPEANGQGETLEESVNSLKEAIILLAEDRRQDAQRNLPAGAQILELA